MKGFGIVVILLVLAAFLLSPFEATDVSELLPVQTLCLSRTDGICRLETDLGFYGEGQTLAEALTDLKQSAPGVVVLSTTRQLVTQVTARDDAPALLAMEVLRPTTELYRSESAIDAMDAADYLSRHSVDTTAAGLQAAQCSMQTLPLLTGKNGRYHIAETR